MAVGWLLVQIVAGKRYLENLSYSLVLMVPSTNLLTSKIQGRDLLPQGPPLLRPASPTIQLLLPDSVNGQCETCGVDRAPLTLEPPATVVQP